jgi:hypothetical protein
MSGREVVIRRMRLILRARNGAKRLDYVGLEGERLLFGTRLSLGLILWAAGGFDMLHVREKNDTLSIEYYYSAADKVLSTVIPILNPSSLIL